MTRRPLLAVFATASALLGVHVAACSSFDEGAAPAGVGEGGTDAPSAAETAADVAPAIDAPVALPDGALDAGTGCNGEPSCERVVFVTETRFTGAELDGVNGADARCTEQARAADADPRVRDHKFRAWLSSADSSASVRLVHGTKPYVLADGTVVAKDWTAFASVVHEHAIDQSEKGSLPPMNIEARVWTGTTATGDHAAADCSGWDALGATGEYGLLDEVSAAWSTVMSTDCNTALHLYCIEE